MAKKGIGVVQVYDGLIPAMRREGHTLEQISDRVGVTRQRVHQILKKFYPDVQPIALVEYRAAEVIGCSTYRLAILRKQGLLHPKRVNFYFRYSREDIKEAFLALQRSCPHCGEPVPLKNQIKYCLKCSADYRRNSYPFKSEEGKRKQLLANASWRERHPERAKEIAKKSSKAYRKRQKERSINQC